MQENHRRHESRSRWEPPHVGLFYTVPIQAVNHPATRFEKFFTKFPERRCRQFGTRQAERVKPQFASEIAGNAWVESKAMRTLKCPFSNTRSHQIIDNRHVIVVLASLRSSERDGDFANRLRSLRFDPVWGLTMLSPRLGESDSSEPILRPQPLNTG